MLFNRRDTCRCIEAAIENPPAKGERVEIFNQIAETARVRDIAEMIAKQVIFFCFFQPDRSDCVRARHR